MEYPSPFDTAWGREITSVPYEPLRKVRVFDMVINSPKAAYRSSPSKLNPTASPFQTSQSIVNTLRPFFEEQLTQSPSQKPSQRFRPGTFDTEEPYYSPPPTFIPPDSPNILQEEPHHAYTNTTTSQPTVNSSEEEYSGVSLMPDSLGNNSAYDGALDIASSMTHTSYTGVAEASSDKGGHSRAQDQLTQFRHSAATSQISHPSNIMGKKVSPSKRLTSNPLVSESRSESPDNSGVPVNIDQNSYESILHQTSSFANLAAFQGIRDWNSKVFDDRWTLRPEEVSSLTDKSEAQSSASTVSPEHKRLQQKGHGAQSENSQSPIKVQLTNTQRVSTEPSNRQQTLQNLRTLEDESHRMKQQEDTFHSGKGVLFVSSPLEEERLQELVGKIHAGLPILPDTVPCSARLLRQFFYKQVFGSESPPAPLGLHQADKITRSRGHTTSLGNLRKAILQDIEDLVEFFKSYDGRGRTPSATSAFSHQLEFMNSGLEVDRHDGHLDVAHPSGELTPESESMTIHGYPSLVNKNAAFSQARNASYLAAHTRDAIQSVKNQPRSVVSAGTNTKQTELRSLGSTRSSTWLPDRISEQSEQSTNADEDYIRAKDLPKHFRTLGIGSDRKPASADELEHQKSPTILSVGQQAESPYTGLPNAAAFNMYNASQRAPYAQGYGSSIYPNFPQNYFPGSGLAATGLPYGYPQSSSFVPPQGTEWFGQKHTPSPIAGYLGHNGLWLPTDRAIRPPAGRQAPLYNENRYWSGNPLIYSAEPTSMRYIENRSMGGNDFIYSASPRPSEIQNRFIPPVPAIARDARTLSYRIGSNDMYPRAHPHGGSSIRFQSLTRLEPAPQEVAIDERNLPFVETARMAKQAGWGVMKIDNIPYDISKASIITFLGNHAKVITSDLGPSVHIIMDRATGKTQECFVEFFSSPDANAWVNLVNSRPNQSNRIGDRILEASLSTQDELLKELFPKAKNVSWEGGIPTVIESEEAFNTGFKSFVSAEELGALTRHAEQPHRSNYTQKCPQRPYESMISLLAKFPWFDTNHYSIATRNYIFNATRQMIASLTSQIRRSPGNAIAHASQTTSPSAFGGYGGFYHHASSSSNVGSPLANAMTRMSQPRVLTEGLLTELLQAGLNAPGFSEKQRWELHCTADMVNKNFNISPLAQTWPWEAMGRRPCFEEDVVEWYASLISKHPSVRPSNVGSPFGDLSQILPENIESMTMEEIGQREYELMLGLVVEMCH